MAISVEDMQNRMRSELSTGSRLAHTAVGVAGLGMAALALSLLATEPVLPVRTQAAFAVIAWADWPGRPSRGGCSPAGACCWRNITSRPPRWRRC